MAMQHNTVNHYHTGSLQPWETQGQNVTFKRLALWTIRI